MPTFKDDWTNASPNADDHPEAHNDIANLLNGGVMQIVNHGAVAGTARPVGAIAVYWIGSVEPTNATDSDLWVAP